MEYATFNGIPFVSYGLIGATTLFLAYSVFSDDNKHESSKTISQQFQSILPTMREPEPEPEEEYKEEEQSIIPEAISEYLPKSEPESIKGGKRKKKTRQKNNKKKTSRTKRKRSN